MPFTGSHPAAILPLLRPLGRRDVPPAALVIGSITPDLPFYALVTSLSDATHSLIGAVSLDPAIGVVAYGAWRLFGAPALDALRPGVGRERTAERPRSVAAIGRRVLAIYAGLAVGALTHVAWDSFTHGGMWGVRQLPWLARQFGPLPGYEWAQYVSGAAGLLAILVWWLRHRRRDPAAAPPVRSRGTILAWSTVAAATLVGAALGLLLGIRGEEDPVRGALFLAATRGGLGAALAVAAIGLAVRLTGRAGDRDSPSGS
ncbi:DUF4184 family protein [Dactylosporangium sp. CA-052675]|uniref:DUF4184 family protein n=1 Tax=Dactylosporangium sp. CA-052675 TaxID=3239927 RepID=UPI003D947D82